MLMNLILVCTHSFASVPSITPIELLSLPEANRIDIGKKNVKDLYPRLVALAFSEDRSVPNRWKALVLAGVINPQGAKADLDRALNHPQWFMRNAALVALKKSNPSQAQRAALQLLGDKALVVRSAAVSVIDDTPSMDVREILWKELSASYNFQQGDGLWVRKEILEKLARHPERLEYKFFVSALKDKDHDLHAVAIAGLERLTQKHYGTAKSNLADKEKWWTTYVGQHSL